MIIRKYFGISDDDNFEDINNCNRTTTTSYSHHKRSINEEIIVLIELAIPTVIIKVTSVMPEVLLASYIGLQFGKLYLDSFMLAILTGNLCTLTLLQGIFSASDTLSPQAFGANNYNEVGLIAIRGLQLRSHNNGRVPRKEINSVSDG